MIDPTDPVISKRRAKVMKAILHTHGDVTAVTSLAMALGMVLGNIIDLDEEELFDKLLGVATDSTDLYMVGYRPGEQHAE